MVYYLPCRRCLLLFLRCSIREPHRSLHRAIMRELRHSFLFAREPFGQSCLELFDLLLHLRNLCIQPNPAALQKRLGIAPKQTQSQASPPRHPQTNFVSS